ncbi:hypothetical protein PDO_2880 [Rhizobium sp. PDO1-076]|uniref:hypothetical protein n=1 Tax=Rhizobium sp. PDO1-076 TaxID=1125979 RepID=UPI00024E242E|nr:hypothetical protein [Rhizobium sp. PDO1-076]EHS49956.1 hypothetical protein PDO_2880 [Rhizobium sp. PDO1-076]
MKGPKIHISRKLVLIFGGVLVLCGGTGAAAVFIGADTLLGPSYAELNGLECTEVKTVEIHKKDHFWIRKYITTDAPGDGLTRVKTALRVAKSLHEHEKADLVQVVVLDTKGPKDRADMRGRAVGADVIFIPDPSRVPEEAAARMFTARYVDKAANENGQFFGERIDMIDKDIEALVAKLDDTTDCLKPEVVLPEGAHGAAPAGHGEAPASGHGEAPAEGHGEAPADAHGEAPAEGHGEAPAEGHGEETPVAEHGTEQEKGWMGSILGMVGLGGSEEPAAISHGSEAAGHDAPAEDGTVANEHGAPVAEVEAAGHGDAAGHGEAAGHASAEGEGHGAPVETNGASVEDHATVGGPAAAPSEPADGHSSPGADETHTAETTETEAEEQGWLSSLKGMVGLGGEETASEEKASPETGASVSDADDIAKKKWPKPAENQVAPDGEQAETKHDGGDWLAKMRAKPISPTGETSHEGAAAAPAVEHEADALVEPSHEVKAEADHAPSMPAEDEAILPPKAKIHGEEEAKAGH